jgi:hypothetical protein
LNDWALLGDRGSPQFKFKVNVSNTPGSVIVPVSVGLSFSLIVASLRPSASVGATLLTWMVAVSKANSPSLLVTRRPTVRVVGPSIVAAENVGETPAVSYVPLLSRSQAKFVIVPFA